MILQAKVRNVTYRNAENGWTVLKVVCEGSSEVVAAVGTFPPLESGEFLELMGEWKEHPKFGKQFQVESFQAIIPERGEALVTYLSNGLFHGMGPVTAKKIVDLFGEQTLQVLDHHPEKLSAIKSLKGKRLQSFLESWRELRESREALLFLYEHHITGSTAMRIWKQYKQQTLDIIRENPYILAEEVWGIGFLRADEIALKLGMAKDSPHRLRSGLVYSLTKAATQGHVYLPKDQLLIQASEILRIGPAGQSSDPQDYELGVNQYSVDQHAMDLLAYALEQLVQNGDLDQQDQGIWIPALRRAEENIARWIQTGIARNSTQNDSAHQNSELLLRGFEREQGIRYSDEQFQGICLASQSPIYVLTGGPGTGKTTTLKGMLHLSEVREETVVLAAPTGRAARRMTELTGKEALTLHRLLEINPNTRHFDRNKDRVIEAHCVVVDEFSMVDTWIASALVQALGPQTRLLLIGDQDQLPSIGPGNILRELLTCPTVPSMRLTRIYRQESESDIAVNAHRVNEGKRPNILQGNNFHYISAQDSAQSLLHLQKIALEDSVKLLSVHDIQVLTPVHRGPLGTQALNPFLQNILNPHGRTVAIGGVRWRVRDRVMQLKNDYERGIFNGDIGMIRDLNAEAQTMAVDFEGRLVILGMEQLDQVSLAYACTVHKSQGSEYKGVVIVLDGSHYSMLQRNLLYTAITRAREHVWIIATPGALDTAIRSNRIIRRYTNLGASIRGKGDFMTWLDSD